MNTLLRTFADSFLSDEQIKQIEVKINEAVEKNIEDILFEAINLKNPMLNDAQQKNYSEKHKYI